MWVELRETPVELLGTPLGADIGRKKNNEKWWDGKERQGLWERDKEQQEREGGGSTGKIQADRRTDRQRWTDKQTERQLDRRIKRWTDRWPDGWTVIDEETDRWIDR